MKQTLFLISLATGLLTAAACQDIPETDDFVPEVAIEEDELTMNPAGDAVTFSIKANCDWTIECTDAWITLSATSGEKDATITVTGTATKMERSATITVTSNEVEEKNDAITVFQSGVTEISSVAKATASGLESPTGSTASLSASYVGLSIKDSDTVTAGFDITAGGSTNTVDATVDRETGMFIADLTGLTPGTEYSCIAWAKLNGGEAVKAEAVTFTTSKVAASITEVAKAAVSNTSSTDGTTASFASSYTASAVTVSDVIATGFTVYAGGTEVASFDGTVTGTDFTADATGLTAGTEYTVVAWATINGGDKVSADAQAFTTSLKQAETIVVDFTDNGIWNLPDTETQSSVSATVEGYTWTIYGGKISGGSLWLAAMAKSNFEGYVQTPKFEGRVVKSITFPNDGSGPSGKAAIRIECSDDGGASFSVVLAATKISDLPDATATLTDQKAGCIYRIINSEVGGNSGYSKTTKMTIVIE